MRCIAGRIKTMAEGLVMFKHICQINWSFVASALVHVHVAPWVTNGIILQVTQAGPNQQATTDV